MEVFDFLVDLVDDLVDVDNEITTDTGLESLGLASLDYIEVQVVIKKKYGVVIGEEVFMSGKVKTFGGLATYIESERSKLVKS